MKKIITLLAVAMMATAVFQILKSKNNMNQRVKKVNVWDTYVTKKDGTVMHFDIIAPVEIKDTTVIYAYGKDYLKTKGEEGQLLSSKQSGPHGKKK